MYIIVLYQTVVDPDSIRRHLENLRIRELAEWDVLAFVYRHGTNIASAEQLARLAGYSTAAVGAALDSLTSLGLIERSHNSQGVRSYRLTVAVDGEAARLSAEGRHSFEELMQLAVQRQGRLLIIGCLRQAATGKAVRGRGGLHLA